MKYIPLTLFILCVCSLHSAEISIEDLRNSKSIIGTLNYPVGTVLEAVGEVRVVKIVKTSTLTEYSFSIKKVNGNDLNGIVTLKLVPSPIETFENIPIGKNVTLKIYETCGYTGVPNELQGKWPDWNYSFNIWAVYVGKP